MFKFFNKQNVQLFKIIYRQFPSYTYTKTTTTKHGNLGFQEKKKEEEGKIDMNTIKQSTDRMIR